MNKEIITKEELQEQVVDHWIQDGYEKELIAVEDMQFDKHMYGSTYMVKGKQNYIEPFKTWIKNIKRK
jgi:hypothetical protein